MRFAGGLLLLVAGLATGTAAVVVHELWWGLPWVAVALLATLRWIGPGWTTRLPLAVGFAVPVGLGARPTTAGDYLVGASTRGFLLLGLTALVVLAAIVTLPRPRPRDRGPESS